VVSQAMAASTPATVLARLRQDVTS